MSYAKSDHQNGKRSVPLRYRENGPGPYEFSPLDGEPQTTVRSGLNESQVRAHSIPPLIRNLDDELRSIAISYAALLERVAVGKAGAADLGGSFGGRPIGQGPLGAIEDARQLREVRRAIGFGGVALGGRVAITRTDLCERLVIGESTFAICRHLGVDPKRSARDLLKCVLVDGLTAASVHLCRQDSV